MKKEMTISELKKKLAPQDKKSLEKLICTLYKSSDMAEMIINLELIGEQYLNHLLEVYKEKLDEIFFPDDFMKKGFHLPHAKAVITEFKKICQNEVYILDLKLYYVECCVAFTNSFGDIDSKFYGSLCKVYHEVVSGICQEELFHTMNDRLKDVVYSTRGIGWGVYDYLIEEYNSIPWAT